MGRGETCVWPSDTSGISSCCSPRAIAVSWWSESKDWNNGCAVGRNHWGSTAVLSGNPCSVPALSVVKSTIKYLSSSALNANYTSEISVILNPEWIICTADQWKMGISLSPYLSQNQIKCLPLLVTIPLKTTTIYSQGRPEVYKQLEDMCCSGRRVCKARCAAPDFAKLEREKRGSPRFAVVDGEPIPRQRDETRSSCSKKQRSRLSCLRSCCFYWQHTQQKRKT